MPNIIDLPDDPKYTINWDPSGLTVEPDTHQPLIAPITVTACIPKEMSPYCAGPKNRIDSGISISIAVSELRSMTNEDMWPGAQRPGAPGGLNATPPGAVCQPAGAISDAA